MRKRDVLSLLDRMEKTDEEWGAILTREQFAVARKSGTEPAFSNKYYDFHEKGTYHCVCCGTDLFSSDAKFRSGTRVAELLRPYFGPERKNHGR